MQAIHLDHDRLLAALEVSGIGIWHFNPITKDVTWDAKSRELFGFSEDEETSLYAMFKYTHHEDIESVRQATDEAAKSRLNSVEISYRTLKPDGGYRWILIKGKTYYDDGNTYSRFTGTVEDISQQMKLAADCRDSESRFRSLIEQAPVATCLFVGYDLVIELANEIMLGYWGVSTSVIGQPFADALPELQSQEFIKTLKDVYTTGIAHSGIETPVKLDAGGRVITYYFDFTYKPILNEAGEVYAVMNMSIDVTERVRARQKAQDIQSRFRSVTEQSPIAIALLKGRDMVIELGNDKIFEMWGKDSSVTGKRIIDALPEIDGQVFLPMLEKVYDTGESFYGYDILAKLNYNGELRDVYFDFTYSPLRDDDNNVTGIIVMAADVTERVLINKKIIDSEAKFRSLIEAAPAGIGLFVGRDLIVEMPNQMFIDIVGKGPNIAGKPLREVMPELDSQAFLQILDDVYTSGVMFQSYGTQVNIVQHGEMSYNYYNITYTPLFDGEGKVYAILDIAIDVTESIKARQATEEAEAALRGAIELADLATWNLDPETLVLTYSERLLEWFGLKNNAEAVEFVLDIVHEKDRERVTSSLMYALTPESGGIYNEEYTIINYYTGRERILHAQGKAFFKDGKAYMMAGTAQDITANKQMQIALENEVKERTHQIQVANRELEDANRRLINSNEELAQYAYVASHDLQEPLRKISMFSNLLRDRDEEQKHKINIDKILNASKRMSLLIKDLLEFSRLLNPDVRFVKTNLKEIVNAIKNDFELLIEEKNAIVTIEELPVIDAVPLQMNQLFYNLVSNALKFVKEDTTPQISISHTVATPEEIITNIHNPMPNNTYYKITVDDNGIGIEEQYIKQIFEVFKRLHGRDEYYGSGIGLSICRRIANTHNGSINIISKPGMGTSFQVILPEFQTTAANPIQMK